MVQLYNTIHFSGDVLAGTLYTVVYNTTQVVHCIVCIVVSPSRTLYSVQPSGTLYSVHCTILHSTQYILVGDVT